MQRNPERDQLWQMGIIAAWYLHDYQVPLYNLVRSHRFPVGETTRRFGKTTTDICAVGEDLLTHENWNWHWCEPWKEQARKVVMTEVDQIFSSCPKKIKPKYYRTDSFYEFPSTGSRLFLLGINEDRGESVRGQRSNGITVDEHGSVVEYEYIINDVLMPMLLTTRGPLHKLGTAPRNLAHPYYEEKERAIREGRFYQGTIEVVDTISEEEKQILCQAAGGPNSPTWLREYMCQPVSDPEMLVVPEYTEDRCDLPDDHPAPPFFETYVSGDNGVDDNTAILFAYHDFERDWIVVEDEFITRGKPTAEIVVAAKEKEKTRWKEQKPYRRVYDADKQVLVDMISTHKYTVYAPEKSDKVAALNALRVRIRDGRFKIKKRCTNLRRQLKMGLWKDDKHLDFERSEALGHLDGVAAAIYLNRSVIITRNPYPQDAGVSLYTHAFPARQSALQPDELALANALVPPRRR